jgi:fucose permease
MLQPKPVLLWIACLSFVTIGIQGAALNVAWLFMQESFDKSLEFIGVVLLANTVGGIVVSFFSGRILATISVGWMCLLATTAEILALLVIALTSTWSMFVAAILLMGLGRAAINVAINTFVAERYPISRMNWLHAIFGIGATLGPLLVTLVVTQLGRPWQEAYLLIAGLQLIMAVLFAITLPAWKLSSQTSTDAQEQRPSFKSTLRLLPVWLGVGLFVCHVGLQVSTGQLTNNLLVEGRGIDLQTAGLWISLFWGFVTFGRIFFSLVIDRIGVARALRWCTFGSIVAALLMWTNAADWLTFFGLALMGFTIAPIFPSSVSRTPGLVGKAHSPNAIGFQMTGAGIGGALLPGLVGLTADRTSLEAIPLALVIIALAQFLLHERLSQVERRQNTTVGASS